MWKLGFFDRLACALLGGFFGAIYGSLLAVIVGWITDGHFRLEYIWYGVAVFATMGFVTGPFVGDIIGDLIHVIYGFFAGIFSAEAWAAIDPDPKSSGWLRTFFLVGFGTGIVMALAWRFS